MLVKNGDIVDRQKIPSMNILSNPVFIENINIPIEGVLNNHDLVLMTVTKDLINFIKVLYDTDSVSKCGIKLSAIIDITLDYRPKIRSITENVLRDLDIIGTVPIITDINKVPEAIKDKTVIKFDHAIMSNESRKIIGLYEEFDHNRFIPDEFSKCLHEVYKEDCKAKKYGDNEFVFMIPPKYLKIYNSWLFYCCECRHLMHVYGDDLLIRSDKGLESKMVPELRDHIFNTMLNSFIGNRLLYDPLACVNESNFDSINLYEVRTHDVRKMHPIFVLSSDFGVGKFTYCRYKSIEDNKIGIPSDYLSPDLFIGMLNTDSYYGNGSMNPAKPRKGQPQMIYDAMTKRCINKGIDGNIYIKLEGSIESYVFPFIWNDATTGPQQFSYMHQYFDDYEFHILYKGEGREDMDRLRKNIRLFSSIHKVDPDHIKLVEVKNHCQGGYNELSYID